jgi:hypothetical protein
VAQQKYLLFLNALAHGRGDGSLSSHYFQIQNWVGSVFDCICSPVRASVGSWAEFQPHEAKVIPVTDNFAQLM